MNFAGICLFIVMEKKIINTKNAPAPIGPYNQAIMAGNTLYISGQVCIDPATGDLKNGNVQEETEQVMKNLDAILKETGMSFNNVVKTTIFITDMKKFSEINEIYGKFFDGSFPARETVQVSALPKFVNVEISMIAVSS
jgi:2-iminobutanoate/2-iminopropanoate deaminase